MESRRVKAEAGRPMIMFRLQYCRWMEKVKELGICFVKIHWTSQLKNSHISSLQSSVMGDAFLFFIANVRFREISLVFPLMSLFCSQIPRSMWLFCPEPPWVCDSFSDFVMTLKFLSVGQVLCRLSLSAAYTLERVWGQGATTSNIWNSSERKIFFICIYLWIQSFISVWTPGYLFYNLGLIQKCCFYFAA